jgi:Dolichyl-phosphate-mannose-protein mannosyltransferase
LTPRSKTDRSTTGSRGSQTLKPRRFEPKVAAPAIDWDEIRPATREESLPVILAAVLLGFTALMLCFSRGYVLLYGDAVAHLGIARRILDTRNPGLVQLGGVWLPLPHLLMLPFVQKMEWWQSGLAGAWPSVACYILGVAGLYRLCRRMLVPRWALAATAFYALNPNLLYLATTAMTEPLFLALLIWMTLLTVECVDEIQAGHQTPVVRRLLGLGALIFAAVFTRYDGWVVGAAVWCVVTWQLWRARDLWRRIVPAFAVFTLLAVAGPVLWLWYNQHFYHDPLDFMRGPYSAPAIEKKTSPPGSRHYRGWHNPGWALLFYTRTAQVVAAAWETGFALMAAALAGLWIAVRRRLKPGSLLLWVPLAFYVYSVAYGSVPIFIPQLYPHSYYNARYGLETLPALALFACVAGAALEQRLKQTRMAKAKVAVANPELPSRMPVHSLYLLMIALAVANPLAMIYGTTLVQQCVRLVRHRPSTVLADYSPPLVLKEALVNATTRVPFEQNLALVLEELPPGVPILMQESDHIGALQDAGIPLRQTINESDYDSWHAALEDPAHHAAYVIAFDGDAVAKAVAEHPAGLQELSILCGTGQPCARTYQTEINATPGVTISK